MNSIVGVGDENSLIHLKSWILLMDEIAVVHDEGEWSFRDRDPALAADLDWLSDLGIVKRVYGAASVPINIKDVRLEGGRLVLIPDNNPNAKILIQPGADSSRPCTVRDMLDALSDVICRMECESFRRTDSVTAVSLREPSPLVKWQGTIPMTLGDVHRVTIRSMPVPSETTSLEELMAFRSDSVARRKLVALRHWMSTISKSDSSPEELAAELEWLLHEYEEHMRVNRLKYKKGVLETIATGFAAVIEHTAKLELKKLVALPFEISKGNIELLESELKAPGREVAFVAHSKEHLRNT